MVSRAHDLTGQRFGQLTVVSRAENADGHRARWNCACDCGGRKTVLADSLKRGATIRCGCRPAQRRHGRHGTPEYFVWQSMIQRCTNPRNMGFRRYGGRGIAVCDRWRNDFAAFLADMGARPSPKHTIDRINNDGNYEPGNCRWVTAAVNQRNKSTNVLTPELAETIRQMSRDGTQTNTIARTFGLGATVVLKVVHGTTWAVQPDAGEVRP